MAYYRLLCMLSWLLLLCFVFPATAGIIKNGNTAVQCLEKERRALLQFKRGIQVDRCGLLSSWGDHEGLHRDCCQWEGVRCSNQTGHVVVLHLRGVQTNALNDRCLKGTVGASLLDLKYLRHLDLSFNNFLRQSIPGFIGSLTNLKHLSLSNANFKGEIPHQLGNLSRLRSLDLNCRSELIPHDRPYVKSLWWLSHLTLLNDINLSGIDLSNVTDWFHIVNNLPYLSVLRMSECQLSVTYPPSLSYVNSSTTLSVISLSSNDFTNHIFDWLFSLSGINTTLVHLDLSYCLIWGIIPTNFGGMSSLSYLDLRLNMLVGPIPSSIWDMPNLSYLSLSWNALDGSISFPDEISSHTLTHLDLSGNSFQVSPTLLKSLGHLCNIRELALSSQNLPFEFSAIMQSLSACALHTLESLDLSNNMVWGSIPDMISSFSSLRELLLYGNQLNGTISPAIGQLSKLEQLDLSSNTLSDTLSQHHLSNLSRLRTLYLSENSALVVNVSDNWIPPFQLDSLTLGSCKLGPHFPKWLQTQTKFSWLDISNAGISGTIPASFWESLPSNLQLLDMSRNSLYGTLPEVSITFDFLPRINLSTNHFSGAVPSFLVNASMLYLDNNMFSKLIPFLCPKAKTNITFLDLSNNMISEKLPDCWTYFDQLTSLYLDNNNLSGNLPASIGELKNLQALHLRNNKLSGEISMPLENCSALVILDLAVNSLSGYVPRSIGNSLRNLGVLILRSNNFVGGLPSSLCELSRLQILDLSSNHISGTIPTCIRKLTAMSNTTNLLPVIGKAGIYDSSDSAKLMWKRAEQSFSNSLGLVKSIDISSNMLEGQIPSGISLLTGLFSLDFSKNNLSGSIPPKIGELTSLEMLDLSNNRLSGKIPVSLANVSSLAILDLSNNKLGGRIPIGTQLQSFNASAYMGNPGLCGDPLPKCPGDVPPDSAMDVDVTQHESSDIFPGLYISVVLGFIVGFWGVCGTLVIKTSWRHAYFRFFDNMKDRLYVAVNLIKIKVLRYFKASCL
ncbi:LRR receptor-like serine/threonine-protein kinase FLS2 [Chenopodium quinoa]|uniref:LRR receptor-like serine/threonine-protein kinase FLS2 n=1 Tax=Chenopodium quinoa TaxID=63459 RepID=UPI000B786AF2|nr:LRR receptor-like serine/threonine-protein kinase FLS2 [Chenopodium quinoa]